MEKLILSSLSEYDLKMLVKEGVKEVLYDGDFKPNSKQEPEYVDIDGASRILMKAKQTIYTLVGKKQIPYYKQGKKLYFKCEELLKWLGQGRRKTVDEIKYGADNMIF
jgi:hypothetical protein